MPSLFELITANCDNHPTAVALGRPDGPFLDHVSLHCIVVAMGETLRSIGIERGDRIALSLPDALHAAVAFLAVATHAVCAPMNPRYRRDEIEFHLTDLGISALVVPDDEDPPALDVAARLGVWILRLVCDERGLPVALRPDRIVQRCIKNSSVTDQALLLHTSGTTARPKIVPLSHTNLITSSRNIARSLALTPHDRCLNVMPLFHIHGLVGALLASIAAGSSVALPRNFDPTLFFEWLDAGQVTWYTAAPTIHQAVLAMAPQHVAVLARRRLRFIRSSSAALPPTLMAALERAFGAPVVEAYGMTEASYQIATNPLPPRVRKSGSVGLAAGPEVAILSENGASLPSETQGEICIRGEAVLTAYEHNDDANAQAFHEGWLRTGDQGFFDADGYLRISGRLKEMINRGGEKVSPLEVEAVLLRHAAIAEAAVFSVPHPTLGEAVAAAVVLHPGATIAESNLRQWLQGYLADIKVPQQIVVVDALPRGSTGKVQRLLLSDALQLRAAFVAPRTPTEHAVAEIWREVLGLERIGILDNFMIIGGDSLKALRVISRLRQALGVKVALAELFARPVLAEFAEAVGEGARSTVPPITAAGREEPLPLSFAQQRLWFLAQMEGVSQAYHIPLGLRLTGGLDSGALRRALDRLVARHEALRTTFSDADGQPVQRIAAEDGGFGLREHDLRQHSDAEGELQRLVVEEADTGFDLQTGPLIRGRLIRLRDSEHALLITMHHIISDGWSMGVLTRELGSLYRAYSQGQADPLPALAIQYPDYAAWQRRGLTGEVPQAQSDYWQRVLAGSPAVLELPSDRRRLVRQDHAGAFVTLELDDKLTAGLKALGQRHGTTLFMTLLAGWAALLARLSGQDDVVIGTPVANRSRTEVEPLIGFFVNTLALRLDLSGGPTVGELLQRVKARALEAQQHQDLPFEQVVEIVRPPRSLAHTPVFQVMFAWQNTGESDLELPGLTVAPVRTPRCFAKFDLTLSLAEVGGRIVGGLEYATALFDRATIERHAGYLRRLLQGMVADDAQAADRLPLLSEAERHQLLVEWNATEADYPRDQCVHELFEAQAARTPDAVAVVHGQAQLTYAELNARANRLAHHLRGLGVTPDTRVAIGLERSVELVLSELAILKCGAAYVPLDLSAPLQRQTFMIEDCQAQIVLTAKGRAVTELSGVKRLDVDELILAGQASHDPAVPMNGEAAAYVMYTSGSTGQPKGVMIPHRAVGRLVLNNGYANFHAGDRVAFAANPAFDASTMEVWAALLSGGCIVVVDREAFLEPRQFAEVLEKQRVTALFLTTALFNAYSIIMPQTLARLRFLLCGGEESESSSFARVLQYAGPQHLIHCYGPTETTTFAVTHEVSEVSASLKSVPIGRPISNTRIYILDGHGEPVPIGVAGEIYIGGAGVARGYLNRPELTAERFLADPFAGGPDARMYKTGDLGRYLRDGTIEFLGRNDFQVKIRGFRIEPGEIEARLAQHPAVREAVVLAREEDGDKQLVAYYTGVPDAEAAGAEALRRHLSAALPDYMMPAAYVRLDALPLTANGKLDRKAMPAPDGGAYAARGYEPPVGEIEVHLARIWAEVLRLERVGRNDNFFELGGHSLMALRLVAQVARMLGFKINVAALFKAPTLQEFAACLSRRDGSKELWQIVEIQPLGEKTPIIAINNTMLYYNLAQKIGTNRRFLGVQLFDPINPQPLPPRGLNEIAADYVRLIREAQPHGPYILLGLCVAGLIAYEAAQQLRQAGETVPMVIMVDTQALGDIKRRSFGRRFLAGWLFRFRALKHQFWLLRRGKARLAEILVTYRLVRKSRILDLAAALHLVDSSTLEKEYWGNNWFLPSLEKARGRYRISPSFGNVVVFQTDAIATRFADAKMGWSGLVKGRLFHHRIPGWHGYMFLDEGPDLIAGNLRPLLDQVDVERDRLVAHLMTGDVTNRYRAEAAAAREFEEETASGLQRLPWRAKTDDCD